MKNKALAIFNLIVDMRHWNASFEAVYVKGDQITPNPYLKPGSIQSKNDDMLIWVNPAFMTRQISDIASQRDGFKLKITSDKLINKHNAPDEEEKKILKYFYENPKVPYYWKIDDNVFRFMGALKTEPDCLKCHKKQGYKVGDIRGGISVSFDASEEFTQLKEINKDKEQTIMFLIFAAIGTIVSLFVYLKVRKNDDEKISKLNDSLQIKVEELDDFNKHLHQKVKKEIDKQREKENLLIQQSKMAAMGEMIGNIAHQWRQPISTVSAIMMNIKWTAISNGVDKNFIDERMKEAEDQLNYMSQTIDDFRNFFKPDKEKEMFDIKLETKKAYKILEATLQYNNINLQIFSHNTLIAYGYPNEFSQVLLNIISNAKDVLIERKIKEPKIEILITNDKEFAYCNIKDNAGGIENQYIEKIFEPYFTTKETHGTGIGLYIAKEIIEKHMQGKLSVKNVSNGAEFIIAIPLFKEDKNGTI